MGGQACVFYGAAEFNRVLDTVIATGEANPGPPRDARGELGAALVAVPELDEEVLRRGQAAYFRCRHSEAAGLRIDVMSKLRGLPSFEDLWQRRTTIELDGEPAELLSLPDLVRAKKTRREKDWPMKLSAPPTGGTGNLCEGKSSNSASRAGAPVELLRHAPSAVR